MSLEKKLFEKYEDKMIFGHNIDGLALEYNQFEKLKYEILQSKKSKDGFTEITIEGLNEKYKIVKETIRVPKEGLAKSKNIYIDFGKKIQLENEIELFKKYLKQEINDCIEKKTLLWLKTINENNKVIIGYIVTGSQGYASGGSTDGCYMCKFGDEDGCTESSFCMECNLEDHQYYQ